MKKVIVCAALLAAAGLASAAYNPFWYDGYGTTSSSDINLNYAARQGGVPAAYTESPADPAGSGWQSQLVGNGTIGFLQLANDGMTPSFGQPLWGATFASPNQNFSGVVGGNVVGTKVAFNVQVNSTAGSYSHAAMNFGAALSARDSANSLGVSLVQDNLAGGLGSFFQLYRGAELINYFVPFNAGQFNFVEVYFTDLDGDGNPWDGGNMALGVAVNGNAVGGFNTSGWTQNYITMEGTWNFAGGLGIHAFDEVTVYSSPVPEPATMALLGLGALGLIRKKR